MLSPVQHFVIARPVFSQCFFKPVQKNTKNYRPSHLPPKLVARPVYRPSCLCPLLL